MLLAAFAVRRESYVSVHYVTWLDRNLTDLKVQEQGIIRVLLAYPRLCALY